MDGAVNRNQRRVFRLPAGNAPRCAVGRAVVQDPEDAPRLTVRGLAHDLIDEAIKRSDAVARFAAAKQLGAVTIPGGQVRPSAAAPIFMFDLHGQAGLRGQGRMPARTGLDAGLLVRRQNKLVLPKRSSLPPAFVQVQDAPCLFGELGVPGENPAAVLPRPDGILMEPTPDRRSADGGHQPGPAGLGSQLHRVPARQRHARLGGQFAGQGFNGDDDVWGKMRGDGPDAAVLPNPPDGAGRNAFAIGRRLLVVYPSVAQSHRWAGPRRSGESSWHAAPGNTATYICVRVRSVPV